MARQSQSVFTALQIPQTWPRLPSSSELGSTGQAPNTGSTCSLTNWNWTFLLSCFRGCFFTSPTSCYLNMNKIELTTKPADGAYFYQDSLLSSQAWFRDRSKTKYGSNSLKRKTTGPIQKIRTFWTLILRRVFARSWLPSNKNVRSWMRTPRSQS